jgi:hypothetical protein
MIYWAFASIWTFAVLVIGGIVFLARGVRSMTPRQMIFHWLAFLNFAICGAAGAYIHRGPAASALFAATVAGTLIFIKLSQ